MRVCLHTHHVFAQSSGRYADQCIHLAAAAMNQAGYLSDSYNTAGFMASKPSQGSRLWARARERGAEDGALLSLEERAQVQEQQLVGQQQRRGAPRYKSVELGALASIAAQARQQLRMSRERQEHEVRTERQRRSAATAAARQHQVSWSSASSGAASATDQANGGEKYHLTQRDDGTTIKMASDGTLLKPKAQSSRPTGHDDGAKLWFDGHVKAPNNQIASASLGRWAMHVSRLSKGKEKVRELAKLKLVQREQQLARVARLDDDLTAKREREKEKSEVHHLVQAARKRESAKRSRSTSALNAATPKLMWPGEEKGGHVGVADTDQHIKQASDATPASTAISVSADMSGEVIQHTRWPGERGYTTPAQKAKDSKGDGLAWPDGHTTDGMPLKPAASDAAQNPAHGGRGGWNDLDTEWNWPQESAAASSKGVESQLNLVMLIDGATQVCICLCLYCLL